MADPALPAVEAATVESTPPKPDAETTKQVPLGKPEKPDEAVFKQAEADKRKDLADAQQATKEAQARVNAARPNSTDSPIAKRQRELREKLAAIRASQQGFKSSRSSTQERLKALDAQLKGKIQEQKAARSRVPYKSVDEVDRDITKLEQQVDSGKMKLVDEKKTLADISSLRKQRKAFAGFDEQQRSIDAIKASIAETKKELDNPEFKNLSDEYTETAKELDTLKAEQDEAFKGLNANRDALTAAKKHQEQCFQDLKQLQNDYYTKRRAFDDYERNARRQQAARKKQEREAFIQARKKRDMEEELELARTPAYADEIHSCDVLIRLLDPSSTASEKSATDTSQFAAVAQRFVDDSDIKGTRLSKKDEEEENYFMGGGGKKSKKGRKVKKAETSTTAVDGVSKPSDMGFYYRPDVAEHFDKVGMRQPADKEDEQKILDEVKAKKQWWKDHQQEKTEENIAAAKKRIEMMENSDETTTNGNHVETSIDSANGGEGNEDLAKGVQKVSLDDKETESAVDKATAGEDGSD